MAAAKQPDVVRFRGTGGAEFDLTIPPEGTEARVNFDARVEKGELVRVTPERPSRKPADS